MRYDATLMTSPTAKLGGPVMPGSMKHVQSK